MLFVVGANSCGTSELAPILKFSPSGKLLASFGAGMFLQPHGIAVDAVGNIWVTDALPSGPADWVQITGRLSQRNHLELVYAAVKRRRHENVAA